MEVDRKPSMGMSTPVSTVHCCIYYPGRILFGERECLCCIQHRYKKENSTGGVTQRWGSFGGGQLSGAPSPFYMHTNFEVSSFSHSGDKRDIRGSINRTSDLTTDTTTALQIASSSI